MIRILALVAFVALAASIQVDRVSHTKDGRVRRVSGNLGKVSDLSPSGIRNFLNNEDIKSVLKLSGEEILLFRDETTYKNILTTLRFDQFYNELPVLGGEVQVHINLNSMEVVGLSGNILDSAPLPSAAKKMQDNVVQVLYLSGHKEFKPLESVSLMYVIDQNDVPHLTWKFPIMSNKGYDMKQNSVNNMQEAYDIYLDAVNHEVLMDIPRAQKAKYRQVFSANNTKDLPGYLELQEGDPPVADTAADQAYMNAGYCYDFYYGVFNRDSWNNEGAAINSSVHYDVNYNNAFWNAQIAQMVYGDGDGIIFANFTNDLSVICHELSHAVTSSTSNLRYWYESGALNEAFSDIMGASAVVYTADPDDNPDPVLSWVIGPNCTLILFNPEGCPDCPLGLRYMNNPTLDGSSRDYYPFRYTGFADQRGVHTNSGIANLAYVLTVQGGVHPQEYNDIFVEAIGIKQAQQIYYVANTVFATSSTDFSDFRKCTEQAASLLYPGNQGILDSVANAWSAVGVMEPIN